MKLKDCNLRTYYSHINKPKCMSSINNKIVLMKAKIIMASGKIYNYSIPVPANNNKSKIELLEEFLKNVN